MIAIIDYNAGNLRSVEGAVKKLGFACPVTQRREEVLSSERVIFAGVGRTGKALSLNLHAYRLQNGRELLRR